MGTLGFGRKLEKEIGIGVLPDAMMYSQLKEFNECPLTGQFSGVVYQVVSLTGFTRGFTVR